MKRKINSINSVLKEVLEKVEPPKEDLEIIESSLRNFLYEIEKNKKSAKINADIFVGGSFAKNTLIRKDIYDIDIFVRFDKKHKEGELSKLTKKILKGIKNVSLIHGSRDYFNVKVRKNIVFEIIPVRKISNSKDAENITDLSYSHVNYIKKRTKNKKLFNEIRLAKSFCHANNCYGAESYINGFSGYGLELLVCHYGSFVKFIREISKMKNKTVIDMEKHYKNKNQVLMDVNASKLNSPIILIDPTYKQRNTLAALSKETFEKFRKSCKHFLKNPNANLFEPRKINITKIIESAKSKGYEHLLLNANTSKQEGDIAGSKLLKFYKYLNNEIKKYFDIKGKGFEYQGKKSSRYLFVAKRKKEIVLRGPLVKQEKHVKKFKKKYKNIFVKHNHLYHKYVPKITLKEFLKKWKIKNKRVMKEMSISKIDIN